MREHRLDPSRVDRFAPEEEMGERAERVGHLASDLIEERRGEEEPPLVIRDLVRPDNEARARERRRLADARMLKLVVRILVLTAAIEGASLVVADDLILASLLISASTLAVTGAGVFLATDRIHRRIDRLLARSPGRAAHVQVGGDT